MGQHANGPRRPDTIFWAFAVAGGIIAAVGTLGPATPTSQLLGAPALALIATAAVAVGIFRWQPVGARAWWWICTGLGLFFVGDLTAWISQRLGGGSFPSMADAFHLAGYPALAAGLLTLAAAHAKIRDRSAVLDAWIIAAAVSLVLWLILVGAYTGNSSLTAAQRVFAIAYPGADVLLVALGVRLLLAFRTRSRAIILLFVALGAMLVGDILFAVGDLRLGFTRVGTLDAWTMAAYVLLGLAGLHKSVADPIEPADARVTLRPSRLALLLFATLLPPALGITHELGWWHQHDAISAISIATIAVSTLVVMRMWGLTRVERAGVELAGRNRFEAMIRHSQDVVAVVQPDGRLDYVSPASSTQWGFEPEQRLGTDLAVLVPNADKRQLEEHLALAVALPRAETHHFELQMRRRDAIVRETEVVATNLVGEPGIDGLVLTFHDATDQKMLERELSHRAFHDSLTGLANRALFFDRVEHAIVRHDRDLAGRVAVLFIDLDDFKAVNDGLGHGYGDDLLKAVGERLQLCLRPGDTAARLGGDEFAILLDRHADLEIAKSVAQRLLEVLLLPISVGQLELTVPASIGIAVAEQEASAQDLMRDADIAMYTAKAAGKGRYEVFKTVMRDRATRRLEVRTELGVALERDELKLQYQPIVDVKTGQIVALEALLRWHHPQRGVIAPLDFVPLAEESGIIMPIGRWVIETACMEAASWQTIAERPIAVAVNLSGVQLGDPDLVEHLRASLRTSGLAPECLVIELTETVLMEDTPQTIRVLEALKDLGVRISIDDFGTGYCSLAYLRRFPVDDVKIDRAFISELGVLPTSGTLAGSILLLAEALGVNAVAEGVETEEQLSILQDLNCDFAQGFYMSKPVDAPAIEELIAHSLPSPAPAPTSD